jgi:hypothetical protein
MAVFGQLPLHLSLNVLPSDALPALGVLGGDVIFGQGLRLLQVVPAGPRDDHPLLPVNILSS